MRASSRFHARFLRSRGFDNPSKSKEDMSYLTDKFRAPSRAKNQLPAVPGQMMEDVLSQARLQRRSLLRGSFAAALGGTTLLSACGGGSDDPLVVTPAPVS